jgi:hypothetical protein
MTTRRPPVKLLKKNEDIEDGLPDANDLARIQAERERPHLEKREQAKAKRRRSKIAWLQKLDMEYRRRCNLNEADPSKYKERRKEEIRLQTEHLELGYQACLEFAAASRDTARVLRERAGEIDDVVAQFAVLQAKINEIVYRGEGHKIQLLEKAGRMECEARDAESGASSYVRAMETAGDELQQWWSEPPVPQVAVRAGETSQPAVQSPEFARYLSYKWAVEESAHKAGGLYSPAQIEEMRQEVIAFRNSEAFYLEQERKLIDERFRIEQRAAALGVKREDIELLEQYERKGAA